MTVDIEAIRERIDRLTNPRGGGSYSQLVKDAYVLLDEVERLGKMLEAAEMKMYRAREALSDE